MENIYRKINKCSIDVSNIKIIEGPEAFFEIIKYFLTNAGSATIITLYFGCNEKDDEIMELLKRRVDKQLYTKILIDSDRTKEEKHVFDKFKKLGIEKIIYQQPKPKMLQYLPFMLAELMHVQHSKLYCFDEYIILSGANLGNKYFTNIIDRYLLIRNRELVKNCIDLMANENKLPQILSSYNHFININQTKSECKILHGIYNNTKILNQNNDIYNSKIDTMKIPICNITLINDTYIKNFIQKDEIQIFKKLFSMEYEKVVISTAYLRFPHEYIPYIDRSNVIIYTPSKESNTFNNSSLSGSFIQLSYEYSIYETAKKLKKARIYRFMKEKFNYHKKGIWLINKDEVITFCGSSNYNYRSNYRDKELNHIIYSKNKTFYNEMLKEVEFLRLHSKIYIKYEWYMLFYIIQIIVYFCESFM